MTFENLMQNLLYVLATVILPLLTTYIIGFLKVKIKENSEKLDNAQLQKYIDAATDAIFKSVQTVNQVYVDEMKRAGKFTKEAQEMAKKMAIEKAKELITEESKNAIEVLYKDFEKYLSDSIETMVRDNKIEVNKEAA